MSSRICITGGLGFIGAHLARQLLMRGDSVLILDALTRPNEERVYDWRRHELESVGGDRLSIQELDIRKARDLLQVLSDWQPDGIVHLAARAGVRESAQYPMEYYATNVLGTYALCQAMQLSGISRLIAASSSSVYGDTPTPWSEDSACHPLSPYADTKHRMEQLLCEIAQQSDMQIAALRFFTVYGEGGRTDMAPYVFTQAMLSGEAIPVYGDGLQMRDFTSVHDIVRGIELLIDNHDEPYRAYNLGNDQPITVLDAIAALSSGLGIDPVIDYCEQPAGEARVTHADITLMRSMEWKPTVRAAAGLSDYAHWLRNHQGLYKSIAQ